MTYKCKFKGKHAIDLDEFESLHNLNYSGRDLWMPYGMVKTNDFFNNYSAWVKTDDQPSDEAIWLRNDLVNFLTKNNILFTSGEHSLILVLNSQDQYCMFELMFSEYIEEK